MTTIYLQEITQQPEDTEILASLTTLKEYREFARTATIHEWKESFVHEVLYALRFGIKPKNERLTLLYPFPAFYFPHTQSSMESVFPFQIDLFYHERQLT